MSRSLSTLIRCTFSRTLRVIITTTILVSVGFTGCSTAIETIEPMLDITHVAPVNIVYPPHAPIGLAIVSELPGMIRLIGYSGSDFVTGTVEVSDDDWVPITETGDSRVTLLQRAGKDVIDSQDCTNLWRLRVSDSEPLQLEICNQRAEGHWNLSGLPITSFSAEVGSAKNAFTFDQPNPTIMHSCTFNCGSGELVVEGILNAACQDMAVESGEGSLTLRFGGKRLLQDMKVSIQASTGAINITLLPEIPTRITLTEHNPVVTGDGILRLDGTNHPVYTTTSYTERLGGTIKVSISGGPGVIYLNPTPS